MTGVGSGTIDAALTVMIGGIIDIFGIGPAAPRDVGEGMVGIGTRVGNVGTV